MRLRIGYPVGLIAMFVVATGFFSPSAALAAECPNEQLRAENNSSGLPSCRAYELVSPPTGGSDGGQGAVLTGPIGDEESRNAVGNPGAGPDLLEGNLAEQLASPLDVQDNGSTVFWQSFGRPPGTGAIGNGDGENPFRSVRTPEGWVTKDLFPSALQIPGQGGNNAVLLGASADGSYALIASRASLPSSGFAFSDPKQSESGEWHGIVLYRVSASGASPEIVSDGERPLPDNEDLPSFPALGTTPTPFGVLSATPDLREIAFKSTISLEASDICNTSPTEAEIYSATTYLWNANSLDGFARQIANHVGCKNESPNVARVPAILPEGQPVIMPTPGIGLSPGPLVERLSEVDVGQALTPLAGSLGGTLLSVTPDGLTAYVLTEGNIYAVSTTTGWEGSATPCVSCTSDQTNVTYITTSQDGADVLFTTAGTNPGLWEWSTSDGAQQLTSAGGITRDDVVVSQNGQYVVALTSAALSSTDTNGGPDLYELSAGRSPVLITSGTSVETYVLNEEPSFGVGGQHPEFSVMAPLGGVSDDGQRVVYDRLPIAAPEVIDEWVSGETFQISPLGSQHNYHVASLAGPELENIFFLAEEPILPWDHNGGQADAYDARIDGGFASCTPGDPNPPADQSSCATATTTPNPSPPAITGYTPNLVSPRGPLAELPPDTSHPTHKPSLSPLTRAQKLTDALKVCDKDKIKARRAKCEKIARKKYSPRKGTK